MVPANRDVLCGRSINNYHVIQRCGRGSMGVVYEARCLSDDQPVALKMMRHDMVYDPQAMMRFHQEADILKQIDHPHCVKLLDDFPALNTMFLVLEFCDGPSLSDVIKSESPMPAEQVRPMIGQLAGALLHAHQLGIIHRDVKPANVLCTGDDTVKLTDFGLARAAIDSSLTNAGQIIGTPRYMSNEQLTGSEIDARQRCLRARLHRLRDAAGSAPLFPPWTCSRCYNNERSGRCPAVKNLNSRSPLTSTICWQAASLPIQINGRCSSQTCSSGRTIEHSTSRCLLADRTAYLGDVGFCSTVTMTLTVWSIFCPPASICMTVV